MFFIASKVLWFFVDPINLGLLGAIVGVALSRRRSFGGRVLAFACLVGLGIAGASPLGRLMIRPLEDRFPRPPNDSAAPYGVILLGGGINDLISEARHQVVLSDAGSRLTETALLARRFPAARILVSGGSGALGRPESKESDEARELLVGLGVDPARITLETRSRNTDENARYSAALVAPKADQVWWLVTSAFHMPRSMGLFTKAGFQVVADPVDYRTTGDARDWEFNARPIEGLTVFEIATHEWVGVLGYRAFGKTDAWFPGPGDR
jgi:uncharacterized SAM-binding protein YcdF (DUF218 family)